jgi:hypothetical protein
MRYRIIGGVLGWLVALLPLVAVNAVNIAVRFSFQETVLAGGIAIVLGLVLGGLTAGFVGGRPRRGYWGGGSGGAAAGGVAAALYLLTVLGLLAVSSAADSAPLLLQSGIGGAVWMLTALAFIMLLLVAIATAAGLLAVRRRAREPQLPASAARQGASARQPVPSRAPGQPLRLPQSAPGGSRSSQPFAPPPASPPRDRGASSRISRHP